MSFTACAAPRMKHSSSKAAAAQSDVEGSEEALELHRLSRERRSPHAAAAGVGGGRHDGFVS